MALNKRIGLGNGVVVSYHRVASVVIATNVQTGIEVASYTSEGKRAEEAAWYEEAALREELSRKADGGLAEEERAVLATEQEPMDVYVETRMYVAPYDQGMTVGSAYAWLKANVPEFEGATDALEAGQGAGDGVAGDAV